MGPALGLKQKNLMAFGIFSGLYYIVKIINFGIVQFMGSASLSV
jgi:hypothetical protein